MSGFGLALKSGILTALVMVGWLGITQTTSARITPYASFVQVVQDAEAVVHGEVVDKQIVLADGHIPWTIYTVAVAGVFAGEFDGKRLSFRCIGGPAPGGKTLSITDAPWFEVGEEIVFLYRKTGLCQVHGRRTGVFWVRTKTNGDRRLVDYRDRAVASFGPKNAELSDEKVVRTARSGAAQRATEESFAQPRLSIVPAADAGTLLNELQLFVKAVKRPTRITSTTDLSGVPDLTPAPGPHPTLGQKDTTQ